MLPSEYTALDIFEKAIIIAFIDEKLRKEKDREKKLEKAGKRGR